MAEGSFHERMQLHLGEQRQVDKEAARQSTQKSQEERAVAASIRQEALELAGMLRERGINPKVTMRVPTRTAESTDQQAGQLATSGIVRPVTDKFWRLTRVQKDYGTTVPVSDYTLMHDPNSPSSYFRRDGTYETGIALDQQGILWHYDHYPPSAPASKKPLPPGPDIPIITREPADYELLEPTSRSERAIVNGQVQLRSVSLPAAQAGLESLYIQYLNQEPPTNP